MERGGGARERCDSSRYQKEGGTKRTADISTTREMKKTVLSGTCLASSSFPRTSIARIMISFVGHSTQVHTPAHIPTTLGTHLGHIPWAHTLGTYLGHTAQAHIYLPTHYLRLGWVLLLWLFLHCTILPRCKWGSAGLDREKRTAR